MRLNLNRDYWKLKFGERVQKIPVNAGFSCPNRDGTLSDKGCTYCLNEAFSPFYCDSKKSVEQQISEGISFFRKKYKVKKFVVYFQTFSATYAPLEHLKLVFSSVRKFDEIIGFIVATRPDCLSPEKLDLLAELGKTQFVGIEFGIESCKNLTLNRINRGHTFEQTIQAIDLASRYNFHIGAHIILGLPGERRDDHMLAADLISQLPLHSLKIHHLQILKGTLIAEEFRDHSEDFFHYSMDDYVDLLCDLVERLNPKIMIDRLSTQSPPHLLISPKWGGLKNADITASLEKCLERRNTFQGIMYPAILKR
ncbi:MAG: TIGR01212 family radical SAM protein [Candidatus Riflebacteria bacterium]|nr:TIGR01212 family radical SAM protein [Candidatus Riflebacteria bacterium]